MLNTNIFAYESFLADELKNQAELQYFINETKLISEQRNTIGEINILNESLAEKIKSSFLKIVNAITAMWKKFLESVNTLVKRDKAYLEKYKDIILKKRAKDVEYQMYNYQQGQKELLNSAAPNFNYNTLKEYLDNEEEFIGKYFSSFVQGKKAPYNLEDLAKTKFRGGSGEVTLKGNQINMTDLYNYCYNYSSIKDKIQKDLSNIQRAAGEAANMIDKMAREGTIQKESTDVFSKELYYSSVYEMYIHEEEKPSKNQFKPGTVKINTPGDNSNTDNKNSSSESNPNNAYKSNTGDSSGDVKKEDIDNGKAAIDRINIYLKVCGSFLGAKQTVAEEIYKAYMTIIRAHVRDVVGEKKDVNNKVADAPTNQNNDTSVKDKVKTKTSKATDGIKGLMGLK